MSSEKLFQWQQTMIRVNGKEGVDHFIQHYGMKLINFYHFDSFSLYFLASLTEEEAAGALPEPGTAAAHDFLWTYPGVVLELTVNKEPEEFHSGNDEGARGFGHLAFFVDELESFCLRLEGAGVQFKKKPHEGRMKTIAFAYTHPDKYWVELITASSDPAHPRMNFSQTMYRIKDPRRSVPFYRDVLGMSMVCERHFDDFSLYFMACLRPGVTAPSDPKSEEARAFLKTLHDPVLELTHNHGTEDDAEFAYTSGNEPGKRGFGHIGFATPDLPRAIRLLEEKQVPFKKRLDEGRMDCLAFVTDPDGYWIEIYERGLPQLRPKK